MTCSIDGCNARHYGRGWCRTHYTRWLRHGDPLTVLLPPHVVKHGTANEYNNYGCRCAPCRAANAEYMRTRYTQPCASCGDPVWHLGRRERTGLCIKCWGVTRRTAEHGTESGYTGGCKCDQCRAASNAARRRRRHANLEASRAYDREYKRRTKQAA